MNAIEIHSLDYTATEKRILSSVTLNVAHNHFVGLVGPNGSGKTSLLRHIYRVLPVEKRTVFVNGIPLEDYSYKSSARQITVLKQENSSEFDYSVMEMVLMGRAPHKSLYDVNTKEDYDCAMNALQFVGMDQCAVELFATLSGGEKQRVLMARSLAQETDILLLDEPTNHLDVHYQWKIMQLIKSLGKTVFSVFHDLNLALSFCDYLYVLDAGEVVAQGKPDEVITRDLLREVFRIDGQLSLKENGRSNIVYFGPVG